MRGGLAEKIYGGGLLERGTEDKMRGVRKNFRVGVCRRGVKEDKMPGGVLRK